MSSKEPALFDQAVWQGFELEEVSEYGGKPRFVGCRTEWLKEADIQRFSSPVKSLQYLNRLAPTVKFQAVELDSEWT